ncbi:MAG: class I SAM-dependent methyltransferase [Anaerolineales bacterium]|jgi:ubiquinone/menaquinone biosynthesis C-methylase UbiE
MSDKKNERMSNMDYRLMVFTMDVIDFFFSHIEKRVARFGIRPGMTVVDYGCGPGRYTIFYSRLAGRQGKVYAVDIHEMAIKLVRQNMEKYGLDNVEPVLAIGYDCGLPDGVADLVTAIDMFFAINNQKAFLAELKRIAKPTGMLVIDDGHQPRSATKAQIAAAGSWTIVEETKDHLTCKPA